jgi:hypothetical protein
MKVGIVGCYEDSMCDFEKQVLRDIANKLNIEPVSVTKDMVQEFWEGKLKGSE